MTDLITANAITATKELAWLSEIIAARIAITFQTGNDQLTVDIISPPDLSSDQSPYANLVREVNMSFQERLILILALAPQLKPELFDVLLIKNIQTDQPYIEFGGQKSNRYFLPTGETAAFIIAGSDLALRYQLYKLFNPGHFFATHDILKIQPVKSPEPFLSGLLTVSAVCQTLLTTGEKLTPGLDVNFPIKLISTPLTWDDLAISDQLAEDLDEIQTWLKHSKKLLEEWGLRDKIKQGFSALFKGSTGTGKTLAAMLLGKMSGLDVYRIDLAMIVSKYVGETEKNLIAVFDIAANRNWILLIDNADALFGRPTTSGATDNLNSQQTALLMQLMEDYQGLVIMAVTLGTMEQNMLSRFDLIARFNKPDATQRIKLWKNAFNDLSRLTEDIDLNKLAAQYPITAAQITNVLRYAALQAIQRDSKMFALKDIEHAIRRELEQDGKIMQS